MSDRLTKLFRLLIDPATSDGERSTAARMMVSTMEAEGVGVEGIRWKGEVSIFESFFTKTSGAYQSWNAPEPVPVPTVPFGKYKGQEWPSVPTDYLHWIINTTNNSWFSGLAQAELSKRPKTPY